MLVLPSFFTAISAIEAQQQSANYRHFVHFERHVAVFIAALLLILLRPSVLTPQDPQDLLSLQLPSNFPSAKECRASH